jgi:hypothetical protein
MTSVVYTESNFYIKNITTYSQYLLNLTGGDYKLITLMGEYHGDEKVKCKNDKVAKDIDTYIIEQGKKCKTKLILELGDRSHLERINSVNITKIIKGLENAPISDIENIETIYNDYRIKYLDPIFYIKLYNEKGIYEISTYKYEVIIDKYIKPFFEKTDEFKDLTSTRHLYSDYIELFYKSYIYNLDQSFRHILKQMENWDNMPKYNVKIINSHRIEVEVDIKIAILENLRDLWSQVSDMYLIKDFFKLDGTKQFIILIGQAHFFNIIRYLDDVFLSMNNYVLTKIGNVRDVYIVYEILHGTKPDCIDNKDTAEIIEKKEGETMYRRLINPKKIKKLKSIY